MRYCRLFCYLRRRHLFSAYGLPESILSMHPTCLHPSLPAIWHTFRSSCRFSLYTDCSPFMGAAQSRLLPVRRTRYRLALRRAACRRAYRRDYLYFNSAVSAPVCFFQRTVFCPAPIKYNMRHCCRCTCRHFICACRRSDSTRTCGRCGSHCRADLLDLFNRLIFIQRRKLSVLRNFRKGTTVLQRFSDRI